MGVLRPSAAGLWAMVGLLFIVALFGAAPVTAVSPAAPHIDHHLTADGDHDHLAFIDHAHIGVSSTPVAPEAVGDVAAPRSRFAFASFGLMFAAALVWCLSPRHTPAAGRGPPRGPGSSFLRAGMYFVRLCISRR